MIKYRVSNDREHIIALVDCRSFQLFSVCYVFFLLSDKNVWNSLIANDSLQAINKMALLNKLNVHVCCSSVCFFNFISSVFVSILVFQFCKCLVWTWNAFHFKSFIKCLFFNECEKYRCLFIISYESTVLVNIRFACISKLKMLIIRLNYRIKFWALPTQVMKWIYRKFYWCVVLLMQDHIIYLYTQWSYLHFSIQPFCHFHVNLSLCFAPLATKRQ